MTTEVMADIDNWLRNEDSGTAALAGYQRRLLAGLRYCVAIVAVAACVTCVAYLAFIAISTITASPT